jgi:hypothetical protein
MLDVGGQDSTEAFEDVGHSDEAREILEGLLVGTLKRQVRHLFSALFIHLPAHDRAWQTSPHFAETCQISTEGLGISRNSAATCGGEVNTEEGADNE